MDFGPNHYCEFASENCRSNPWVYFLYINNFITKDVGYTWEGADISCLGQTWYLANDMQFFFISPPIIYILWRWKRIGLGITYTLITASAIIPAVLTYVHRWGPGPLFTGIDEKGPDQDYMEGHYVKPWNRYSPYIVGTLLGNFNLNWSKFSQKIVKNGPKAGRKLVELVKKIVFKIGKNWFRTGPENEQKLVKICGQKLVK